MLRKMSNDPSKKSSGKPVNPPRAILPKPLPKTQENPGNIHEAGSTGDLIGPLVEPFGQMTTGSETQTSISAPSYQLNPRHIEASTVHYKQMGRAPGAQALNTQTVQGLGSQMEPQQSPREPSRYSPCQICGATEWEPGHVCLQVMNNTAYPPCRACSGLLYPNSIDHNCHNSNPCQNCEKPFEWNHACQCIHCKDDYEPGHHCQSCPQCGAIVWKDGKCLHILNDLDYPPCPLCRIPKDPNKKTHVCGTQVDCQNCGDKVERFHACKCKKCLRDYDPPRHQCPLDPSVIEAEAEKARKERAKAPEERKKDITNLPRDHTNTKSCGRLQAFL